MIVRRPKIINVTRKPSKCPVCGGEVVDIIYGTGDMTEVEFLFAYRRAGMMGGDTIPRRPPIWECSCGCRRFRKVNADGTDSPVKVKLLKNMRKRPATVIHWTTKKASDIMERHGDWPINHYEVAVETELGEKETLRITAANGDDAKEEAKTLVETGRIGLKGIRCVSMEVYDQTS